MTRARAVVVGAGWSGLACAIELAAHGLAPLLVDAAPRPGGRARAIELALGGRSLCLDNGQHLLLGAYRDTLQLMRRVGADPALWLHQQRFALRYPDGWHLEAGPGPAPLHLAAGLLGARGMSATARAALALWVLRQRTAGWRTGAVDGPAAALFADQPGELTHRLWRPLCLAALNVELEQASARILLNVLRDSLGGDSAASRMLVPHGAGATLSRLFPDPALDHLRRTGATVRLRTPVLGLACAPASNGRAGWRIALRDASLDADAVVLALPPPRAAALLAPAHPALAPTAALLQALRSSAIATAYLAYPAGTRLRAPIFALMDDPRRDRYGQWVFDRGAFDPQLDGVLAVVVSGDGEHLALGRERLAQLAASQLQSDLGLAPPLAAAAVIERHATLVPAPGLQRPAARLPMPGLYLAGDAADSPYPSTIEGSVRSGLAAAQALIADARREPARVSGP